MMKFYFIFGINMLFIIEVVLIYYYVLDYEMNIDKEFFI